MLKSYQLVVFAAQNILTRTESKLGYLLLRCIRHFVMFDMYAALEVHTEDTIAAGRETLREFSTLLDVSSCEQYFLADVSMNHY